MGRKLVAFVAVFALLLTSCGDDDEPITAAETETEAEPEGAVEPTEGEAAEEEAAGEIDPAAVLRFQWGTPAGSNYDPHTAFNPFVNVYLYPAYDRLTELTPDGELRPMLAESWEFQEGDTVLRLNLRDDVTFHDGTPFNAEAVKANIERGQTLEASSIKADLAAIEEVVVVDEFTVDLMLSGPGAALPALLADRAGMMVSPAALQNEDLDLQPVGTGPYQVATHQPGSVITYEPYEGYWDPSIQTLGGIELTMQLDPEARLRALLDGQIDGTTLNPDQIARAEEGGATVNTQPTTGTYLLYLNMAREELSDHRVREAISLAIDREGIAEALHGGQCTPTNQVFPTTYWAGNPDVGVDSQDLERAQQLMQEAGYPDGFAMDAVVVNVPFYSAQLESLQAQLTEIGIDLTVNVLEPTELLSRFATGGTDAYYSQWPGAVDPAKTVASLFAVPASLNPGSYVNPEVQELADQGLATIDQPEREPIYRELSQVAAEDYFHIPVCHPLAIWVTDPDVGNVEPTLGGSFDFRGATVSK